MRADLDCYKTRKHEKRTHLKQCFTKCKFIVLVRKELIKLAWQPIYRISSFGHFFVSSPGNQSLHCKEKQTIVSPCKRLEGRQPGKQYLMQNIFTSANPSVYCVLLFLYIYVLPHLILILFTIVNKRFTVFFQSESQKTYQLTRPKWIWQFTRDYTKLVSQQNSRVILSSFFFIKTQYRFT